MATGFCLIPTEAEKLKRAIAQGEINPDVLAGMSSDETRKHLEKFLSPENSRQVNLLYEKKLLLKNQDRAIFNLFKDLTGLSAEEKAAKMAKIKEELARKNSRLFHPQEGEKYLKELVNETISKKYKAGVSDEEIQKIIDLSEKAKALADHGGDYQKRVAYGRAQMAVNDYVNSLNPEKANVMMNVLGVPRAAMATLDLSAPLNQGWGMLSRKEFYTNVKDMIKAAGSDEHFQNMMADIMTRDTYKGAKAAGLRLTDIGDKLSNREEVFMTNLLSKIPGVKGSERAYTGFLNKLRMDIYDDIIAKAAKNGEDITKGSKASKDIAAMINNFTGGASIGNEGAATQFLNAAFFSPRKIVSSLQILNPKNYLDPRISKTARKEALRNLLGSIAVTGSVVGLAKMAGGDAVEVELDPRSSDFGSIKIGDTRIDLSGGMKGYANLISRILTNSSKSTNTGIVQEFGTGFGKPNALGVAGQFARNKLSPVASFLVDARLGENSLGEKKTLSQSALDRIKPIFLSNLVDIAKSDGDITQKGLTSLVGLLGSGVSVYSVGDNWNDKESSEMLQLKEKVGQEQFDKINSEFNAKVKSEIQSFRKSAEYKALDNEKKAEKVNDMKSKVKKELFQQYGFKATRKLPTRK